MNEAAAKARLVEVLRGLEKAHGKVYVLPEEPPLDHAVFLVLRDDWDWKKAQKALRILQNEFVDWNEVRVSTPAELRGALAQLGDKDLDVKIEKIRTLLAALWKERNATSLDFIREMETESRRRLLSALGVLTPAQVQVLLQWLSGPQPLLVHPNAVRVLTRIGVIPRVHSESGARKVLEKLVDPDEIYPFQAYLTQHGEDVCQAKSPRCGECAIVELCAFKRKIGVAGEGD